MYSRSLVHNNLLSKCFYFVVYPDESFELYNVWTVSKPKSLVILSHTEYWRCKEKLLYCNNCAYYSL